LKPAATEYAQLLSLQQQSSLYIPKAEEQKSQTKID